MGSQYKTLSSEDIQFIQNQHLFYMASASGKEVNLSPKGFDAIHVLDSAHLLYLDYPGSGNRTARDISNDGEITLVFNAFSGNAKILRLFCKGELVEKDNSRFESYFKYFDADVSHIRRIIQLNIYAVESSCGMGVPKMQFQKERSGLKKWIAARAQEGTLDTYITNHHTPPDLKSL